MNEYPKMLYRPGFEIEWDGRHLEIIIANDIKSEVKAIADGYIISADFYRLDAKV